MWEVGRIIDGTYLVKKEIGSGGEGKVMLVSDLDSGIDLAVKSPHVDNNTFKLFLEECKHWIELPKHPHITTCFFFFSDKIPRLFIEYVDGGNLWNWIDKEENRIDFKSKISIAIQIANGLSYAHKKGLIHLDLKLENILVYKKLLTDLTPRVAITDFGNAQMLASSGEIRLLPRFLPPELYSQSCKADEKCDIFSFGILLCHLLGNDNPPFSGVYDEGDIMYYSFIEEEFKKQIEKCYKKSIHSDLIQDIVKNDLMKIIKKSTANSPSERYTNFEQVEQDLMNVYEKYSESGFIHVNLLPLENVKDLVNKSVSYLYLDDALDEARKCLKEALQTENVYEIDNLYSHHNYCLLSWKEFGKTDKDYLDSLNDRFQKSRIYPDIYYKKNLLMAQAHVEKGDLNTALRYIGYIDHIRVDNSYARAKFFDIKGIICLGLGRYSRAINCFRNANKFFQDDNNESSDIKGFKQYYKAIKCFRNANKFFQDNNSNTQYYWLYKIHLALALYRKNRNRANKEVSDLIGDAIQVGKDEIGFWKDSEFKPESSIDAVIDCFKNVFVPRVRQLSQNEIRFIDKRFKLGWLNKQIDFTNDISDNPITTCSPDGRHIAAGYNDGRIVISDTDRSEICRVEQDNEREKHALNSLKYSPDGRHIAAGYNDGRIVIWKWDKNKEKIICITTLLGHRQGVKFLSFSTSRYIFSRDQSGYFACWDIYDLLDHKSSLRLSPPLNYLLEKPITSGDDLEAGSDIKEKFEQMKKHYYNEMYQSAYDVYKENLNIQKYLPARHLLSDIITDPKSDAKRTGDCEIKQIAIFRTTNYKRPPVYSPSSYPEGRFQVLLKDNKLIELSDEKYNTCLAIFPINTYYNTHKVKNYEDGNRIGLECPDYKARYNSKIHLDKYEFVINIKEKNGKLVVWDRRKEKNKFYDLYHDEYLYYAVLSSDYRYILCAGTKTLKVFELEWEWEFSNKKVQTKIVS